MKMSLKVVVVVQPLGLIGPGAPVVPEGEWGLEDVKCIVKSNRFNPDFLMRAFVPPGWRFSVARFIFFHSLNVLVNGSKLIKTSTR